MPAKGSIGKFHGRHHILNKKLWRSYKKETGNKISWADFSAIVLESMKGIREWVVREPIGFQLPGRIGNLAINKFKTYGTFKTYIRVDGRSFLGHNLHTGGYTFRIQWFKATRKFAHRYPYWWFTAERKFNRSLAPILKSQNSPIYNTYMQDHFIKVKK